MYVSSVPVQVKWDISNLGTGKNILYCEADQTYAQVSKRDVESLTMEMLKTWLDKTLNDWLWAGGLDEVISGGHFLPQPFCDSVTYVVFI